MVIIFIIEKTSLTHIRSCISKVLKSHIRINNDVTVSKLLTTAFSNGPLRLVHKRSVNIRSERKYSECFYYLLPQLEIIALATCLRKLMQILLLRVTCH